MNQDPANFRHALLTLHAFLIIFSGNDKNGPRKRLANLLRIC